MMRTTGQIVCPFHASSPASCVRIYLLSYFLCRSSRLLPSVFCLAACYCADGSPENNHVSSKNISSLWL